MLTSRKLSKVRLGSDTMLMLVYDSTLVIKQSYCFLVQTNIREPPHTVNRLLYCAITEFLFIKRPSQNLHRFEVMESY